MKNLSKNSEAFVSLSFVFILMTFTSLYLTATFAIALSMQRDYVRSTCVTEATAIQSATLKNVRQLFNLNPASTALRLDIKATQAALAVAIATMNLELVPVLEHKLNALHQAQKTLDGVQRTLISKTQLELLSKHLALIAKLQGGQEQLSLPWRFMLRLSTYVVPRSTPILAIRPDSEGGLGPNYEWQENAEHKQSLAYAWNMAFATLASYQSFFTWTNVLSLTCKVSPRLGDKKWHLTINADK